VPQIEFSNAYAATLRAVRPPAATSRLPPDRAQAA